ncbi:MAG: hypothetical protein ABIR66_05310 [Saprospiraceae bacterium]
MNFHPNQLFHVYNQGNNRQTIFFTEENYQYFLRKMKAHILPFADIISYCLMPSHFHWQIYVYRILIERKLFRNHLEAIEMQRRKSKYGDSALVLESSKTNEEEVISLNESIGILQRSYTRALNKEKGWSGSLFRNDCKAKDGWIDEFITLTKASGKLDYRFTADTDYGFSCMQYIHQNPVEAGLVKEDIDWKYSSAREYAGLELEHICNLEMGRMMLK